MVSQLQRRLGFRGLHLRGQRWEIRTLPLRECGINTGEADFTHHWIRLDPHLSDTVLRTTLLHEIFHVLLSDAVAPPPRWDTIEESVVAALSEGLGDALRLNKGLRRCLSA